MLNFGVKITKVLTKSEIKLINSLKRKSKRKENGLFVVEGIKNIRELLRSDYKIQKIFSLKEVSNQFEKSIPVTEKELQKITHLSTPNQVLALAEIPQNTQEITFDKTILVIDGVNDPGNLGTIIRTADWFGIDTVICSENSVDCYNSKVVMSTMGSLFRVKVHYRSLPQLLTNTHLPIYGALLEGNSIYTTDFTNPCIILMGSESHGISQELIPSITHKVTIPGAKRAESLNLGVSTGIFCSEYYKNTL